MIYALCQVMTEGYAGSMQVFSYFRSVQRLTGALAGSTMHRTGTHRVVEIAPNVIDTLLDH
jgi:hypothetical protein